MKAIVTGATKGIGLAITRALLDDGAQVFAVGRDMTLLENLPSYDGRLHLHTANLMNTDLQTLARTAAKTMGGIDVLVNNAGITLSKNIEETREEEWDRLMYLNARVPYFLSQAVIPYLKTHTRSFIIHIAIGGCIERIRRAISLRRFQARPPGLQQIDSQRSATPWNTRSCHFPRRGSN